MVKKRNRPGKIVQYSYRYINRILLWLMVVVLSSCCAWEFDASDFDFNAKELNHFASYEIGDTSYFISDTGDVQAITVMEIEDEREKGSKCYVSKQPYHQRSVHIKHLPEDLWYHTTYYEGETKEINYQSLLSVTKFPMEKSVRYIISFQGFIAEGKSLSNPGIVSLPDGQKIHSCYTIDHSHPESIKKPTDIVRVYWTDKFGLTAYTNRRGETWVLKDVRNLDGI